MRAFLHAALSSLTVAAALTLLAPEARAQRAGAAETESAAGADPANVAFRRGNEHAKAERWADAAEAYRDAFRLRPAWDIASNLGIAELELGRARDAAEHLDFALRHIGATAKPEYKKLIEESLAKARAAVGTAKVRVSADGATLRVDGVAVGASPLEAPLFLSPGSHRVEASRGEEAAAVTIEMAAGEEKDVPLELKGTSGPSIGGPMVPPVETNQRPLWPALVLGGGALVGIGVGVGLTVAGSGARSDADDLVQSVADDGGRCIGTESSGPCAEARDRTSDANTLRTLGVVAFVVGGLSAAGLVTYLVWPSDTSGTKQATALVPFVSPREAGATLSGSF